MTLAPTPQLCAAVGRLLKHSAKELLKQITLGEREKRRQVFRNEQVVGEIPAQSPVDH